jgi:hypothetical protein
MKSQESRLLSEGFFWEVLMKLENALNLVAPQWHKDYLHFIETGEAPKEFLSYIDQDSSAQEAVEMAFNAQADAFEGLARELRGTSPPEGAIAVPASVAASDKLTQAFEVVLRLPKEERTAVVATTASTLGRVLQPDQQRTAHSVAQKLENALANTTCVAR